MGGGAGRGAWHRLDAKGETLTPHAGLLPQHLPHSARGPVKRAGNARRPEEVQDTAHSASLPSPFQTLGTRVLPIPRPPHCPPAVGSKCGMEGIRTVSSSLGAPTVPPRHCWAFTKNVFRTLPITRERLQCALPARSSQGASDLASVRPARQKGLWQSSRAQPSSAACDNSDLAYPRTPLHTRSLTKQAATAEGHFDSASESLAHVQQAPHLAHPRFQAWHLPRPALASGRTHH